MRRRLLMDASRVSVENERDGWLVDDDDDGARGVTINYYGGLSFNTRLDSHNHITWRKAAVTTIIRLSVTANLKAELQRTHCRIHYPSKVEVSLCVYTDSGEAIFIVNFIRR